MPNYRRVSEGNTFFFMVVVPTLQGYEVQGTTLNLQKGFKKWGQFDNAPIIHYCMFSQPEWFFSAECCHCWSLHFREKFDAACCFETKIS
jgi:hypothetical protein